MVQVQDALIKFIIHNYLMAIFLINKNIDLIFKSLKQDDYFFFFFYNFSSHHSFYQTSSHQLII